jgi:hypothetical protein
MLDARASVQLLVRLHPGSVNRVRLLIRAGDQVRMLEPHIGWVWERMVRPRSGGPAIIGLGPRVERRTVR